MSCPMLEGSFFTLYLLCTEDSAFDEFGGVGWLDFSYWFHVFHLDQWLSFGQFPF